MIGAHKAVCISQALSHLNALIAPPMVEPSSPFLPVEIMHLIFKELDSSNDQQTLKACSLVSHLFLVLCRRHLFSSVTIFVTPDTKDTDDKPDQQIESAVQFLSFLAANDHVSSFIQNLSIRNDTGVPVSSTWTTVARSLDDLLPKLSLLTSLSIYGNFIVDWTSYDKTLREVLMRLCRQPTLKTLDLNFMGISQQELLSFISIGKLSLTCIHLLNPSTLDSVSKNLTSPNNASHLSTLSVVFGDLHVSQTMWSLVKACASSLKSLKWMSSRYHRNQEIFLHFIDLQILPKLTSLSICVPLRAESSLRDLINLLGKSPERSVLEILEIVCDYDRLPGSAQIISTWAWQELDDILTSPALAALRVIKISFKDVIRPKHILPSRDHKAHAKEAVELFRNNLPNAYAKGLIYGDE